MPRRSLRWLVFPCFLGFAGLAAAQASTAPSKSNVAALDPVWAKQLVAVPRKMPSKPKLEATPNFAAVRKMTLGEKAKALATTVHEVQGPLHFSAGRAFLDDRNYINVVSGAGTVSLNGQRQYFMLTPAAGTTSYLPYVELNFAAGANRRYLLECLVDGDGTVAQVISARGGSREYMVRVGEDDVTLIYEVEAAAVSRDISVRLEGVTPNPWYFDGCELSWTDA